MTFDKNPGEIDVARELEKQSPGRGGLDDEATRRRRTPGTKLFLMVIIALGVLLGSIPVYIPGVPAPLSLGLAGGPVVVAIILPLTGLALNPPDVDPGQDVGGRNKRHEKQRDRPDDHPGNEQPAGAECKGLSEGVHVDGRGVLEDHVETHPDG